MKPILLFAVLTGFTAFSESGDRPIELYVAPGGDDGAAGTCAVPLATPTGARNRLRALRAAGGGFSGARVVFADGVYRLSCPLELDSRDSGLEGALVEWRAANRGKVVFSGAVVPEWRSVEDFSGCEIPAWAKGTRVVAEFGVAEGAWREYSFAFTPKVDGAASLLLMGAYGEKTLYDDFRVEGVPFGDPGCETNAPPWHEKPCVERVPLGDIDRPYGILAGDEHGFRAAEGRCAAAANHERQMRHAIVVKKGERVKVSFRARSFSRP